MFCGVSDSLQISDAEEEDQGNYECMAENSHGSALSVMATLFVRGELSNCCLLKNLIWFCLPMFICTTPFGNTDGSKI